MDDIIKFTYIYFLIDQRSYVGSKAPWERMVNADAEYWEFTSCVKVHKSKIKEMYKYMVKNG